MDELLRYYPTKGGLVKGKSKRVEHPNLDKMPDYRPEEELDFLPLLSQIITATGNRQVESSTTGSQASTIVDPLHLDDANLILSTYSASEEVLLDDIPDEDQDSEDEELLQDPEIDDDEEIKLTGQIQATLASTVDFQEFVEETQNIDGDYRLSVNQEFVEKLYVGQQWLNKENCRDYLKELAIDMNYCIIQVKNKEKKQSYKCKDVTCGWKVYCSVLTVGQTFECKTGHFIHTCESYHGLKRPLSNARWVAKVMLECYKAHPNYKPKDLQSEVKKNYKVDISYYTAWHAYHLCNEKIWGSYEEGYSLLPALCDQIKRENVRNIASLRTDPTNDRFVSLCISYRVSLDSFLKSCRPFLGLDGCHLQGKYGGTLLAITALDGNNVIFPIAIYICQSECKETWLDFLSIMAVELQQHPRALTFISDRQKGLIEGVSQNFSNVTHQHRFCFRHIYQNFKKSHPGKNLEFIVWRAARSFSEVGHKIRMERLKEAKPSAPEWFDREPVESWARCYFDRSSKCEHVTSNFCEAFNSWILSLRKLPICKFVENFHLLMMRIFYDREEVGKKMPDDGVVNRVTDIIKKHLYFSHEFTKQPSTKDIWAVFDTKKEISWVVNLEVHTCTCNAWQVCGIPCVHAICASLHSRTKNQNQYVHSYMSVDTYRQLYSPSIEPLNHRALWVKNARKVDPPKCSRPPGRPRAQRRRDRDEGGTSRKYMCGKCYVYGHNRSTCKGAAAEDQEQAPATFTGPHVRPNPTFRPPATFTATSTFMPNPTRTSITGGRGSKGGRGSRGGRGGRTSTTPPAPSSSTTSTTPPAPSSSTTSAAPPASSTTFAAPPATSTATTSTTPPTTTFAAPLAPSTTTTSTTRVAFRTTVRTRGGRGRRGGRGSGGHARGNPVHAVDIRPPSGRGAGLVSRGGGTFSSRRGHRMMHWFGTPEQWANEEN